MKEKIKQLFGLFGAFAVVGVTTFGGGYAMLPALQREVVEKRRWATEEEVMDWYAIGQCTPGVIAVNTATFVGQKQAGVWGGIFATLGVVFPSLVIIMIIAAFIQNFAHLPAVQNAFAGIRVRVRAHPQRRREAVEKIRRGLEDVSDLPARVRGQRVSECLAGAVCARGRARRHRHQGTGGA